MKHDASHRCMNNKKIAGENGETESTPRAASIELPYLPESAERYCIYLTHYLFDCWLQVGPCLQSGQHTGESRHRGRISP